MTLLFPTSLCGLPSDTGPRSLAIPGSSSHELRLLSRVRSCSAPARGPQAPRSSPGVADSPSRHELEESTLAPGLPSLPWFRPQCFSHSRRLAPPRTVRVYFIPQPRPRFALQGFSPAASRVGSSPNRALMSLAALSCGQVAPPAPDPATSPSGPQSDC
jgi:hypothetical protein